MPESPYRSSRPRGDLWPGAAFAAAVCAVLATAPGVAARASIAGSASGVGEARVAAPPAPRGSSTPPADCVEGVVKDDGSLETGYGWVPSVVDGRYVQEFTFAEFPERGLADVCICWTRNQLDDSISFEVQLYRHGGEDGAPMLEPEISVAAVATAVPAFPEGRFYRVEIPGTPLPPGLFSIGVRWDATIDRFFFVCADQSPATPFTNGWFIDDRADQWADLAEAADPIFAEHAAMLIRPVAGPAVFPVDVPLSNAALAVVALLLAGLGCTRLRR